MWASLPPKPWLEIFVPRHLSHHAAISKANMA
jgi:hypothetical protein